MMKLLARTDNTYVEADPMPRHIIDAATSYKQKGYFFAPAYRKGFWDGYVRFFKIDQKSGKWYFPTGFLDAVCATLDLAKYPYVLDDERVFEVPESQYVLKNGSEPDLVLNEGIYSYQGAAIDACLAKGRGVVHACTGAGKTEIGAAVIKSYGKRTVWFTHRANLLRQTHARLSKRLGVPVGIAGDFDYEIRDISVVMVQTANNCDKPGREALKELIENAEVVIADEVHHLESDQWYNVFERLKAPYRFGLTATPNFSGPGMALQAQTGGVIYKISAKDLVDAKVLVPPRIWIAQVPKTEIPKETTYKQVYKQGVVNNVVTNSLLADIASVLVSQDKIPLILVKQINHGEMIEKLLKAKKISSVFISGRDETQVREDAMMKLEKREYKAVVANADIMGEGVDYPFLRSLINATGTSGGGDGGEEDETGRLTVQMLGRILRRQPGKEHSDYIDFMDTSHKFLKSAAKDRISTLESLGFGQFIKYWSEYAG
jgi:superfamily II DNA or RNA helicase